MKILLTSIITVFTINICAAQTEGENLFADENYIYIFVNEKGKIIMNGEKTKLKSLEVILEDTDKKLAKIGTVKPTPQKVFSTFQQVVSLCEKYKIETEWYRDPEFSVPFFED